MATYLRACGSGACVGHAQRLALGEALVVERATASVISCQKQVRGMSPVRCLATRRLALHGVVDCELVAFPCKCLAVHRALVLTPLVLT